MAAIALHTYVYRIAEEYFAISHSNKHDLHVVFRIKFLCFDINNFTNKLSRIGSNHEKCKISTS